LRQIDEVMSGASRWALVEGDCLDVLPTMGERSVAHVITDPPYEAEAHTLQRRCMRGGAEYRRRGNRGGVALVEPLTFEPITEDVRDRAGAQIGRLAARWALVFCQVEATSLWRGALVCGNSSQPTGHAYKRTCIWYKPDAQPQLTGDRPGTGYESIVVTHASGRSRWNAGGRVGVFQHSARWSGGRPHDHPTEKPYELMADLVMCFTDPDDIVLDPFAGSGTTGVACLRLGRRFIGIEKNATYAQLARDRLDAEKADSTLVAKRSGQTALFGK